MKPNQPPQTIPAFLQLVQTADPRLKDILRACPRDVRRSVRAVERAGFRKANGHITPEVHALIRVLNANIGAMHAVAVDHPVDALAAVYLRDVRERHKGAGTKQRTKELPGLGTQARNLAVAVVKEGAAILRGDSRVTEEEHARRMAICLEPCPRLLGDADNPNRRCGECGCFVKRKSAWRSQSCPLGKW